MKGLEIVMDILTLEIYEVIDHDEEMSSDLTVENTEAVSIPKESQVMFYQMNLFKKIDFVNTS